MPFPCFCPSLCKQLGGGHYLPSPYLLLWKRLGDCYRLPFPGLSFRNGQEIVIAHPPLSLSSEKPKLTLIAFSLLFNVAYMAIYGHFVPFLAILAMLSFFPIVSVVFGRFDLLISIFCHFWLFLAIFGHFWVPRRGPKGF